MLAQPSFPFSFTLPTLAAYPSRDTTPSKPLSGIPLCKKATSGIVAFYGFVVWSGYRHYAY